MWDTILEILKVIAPSLVVVGLGAIVVQSFFISRANEAVLVDFLIKELEDLRNDTLEYWNLPAVEKDEIQRQSLLAQKIVGNLKALTSDIRYMCDRYCKKQSVQMNTLLETLHDACTGGDFDTNEKKIDKQRYIIIVNSINSVKSALLRRKL